MNRNILIVEDQKSSRELLSSFLEEEGYKVTEAGTAEQALKLFEEHSFACALLDIRLPGMDGIELLSMLREIDPEFKAIFMTAFGSVDIAVKGMEKGAFSFIQKPVNLKQLLGLVEKATFEKAVDDENREVHQRLEPSIPAEIIAESRAMKEIFSRIAHIAPTDVPVLIEGQSGTGKEIVARAIHNSSLRADRAFIALNCAALPENLIESELFGYEQGAFSGARGRKKGMAEMADGGTLFLDEIGDFPITLQPKLLRMLEDSGFYRVGGTDIIKPDIRIIAATNRGLKKLTDEGFFREDLYFRLKGIPIYIPSLKERPEDILALTNAFVSKYASKYKRQISGLSDEARAAILRHDWPGNVRELLHALESAIVIARRQYITPDDLGLSAESAANEKPLYDVEMKLADVEKSHISRVLSANEWNISKAANVLGIHRNTLSSKIREYDLKSD